MDVRNKLYKNQGIHVITVLFTVEQGITKVLLVKRTNEPFAGYWVLTGGALYNNEDLITGALREIEEKSGIKNINITEFKIFGEVNRSPVMRMVAVCFFGVIDSKRVNILRKTRTTSNADWFALDKIPPLGFDHEEILAEGVKELQKKIVKSNILKVLYPDTVTIPELQKVYEAILNKKFDRRNFRKKILSLDILDDTSKHEQFDGNRPAKLYKFKKKIEDKEVM
ncbi:MAG: NUDIX domain-containing protein [Bacilli bacterium]|nr:NUDIX domain-containing protein [Bacilli bacterium]